MKATTEVRYFEDYLVDATGAGRTEWQAHTPFVSISAESLDEAREAIASVIKDHDSEHRRVESVRFIEYGHPTARPRAREHFIQKTEHER